MTLTGVYFFLQANFMGGKSVDEVTAADEVFDISKLLNQRRSEHVQEGHDDPFGDDGKVNILLLGIDNRIGQKNGHCDAIQFIEIDRVQKVVSITAVPRGTYSPLPGTGHLPTDYYVSKSCEVGGVAYGIEQIERILGKKADFVAMVGFSQVAGILRLLDMPTTETLQWLRHRQGYAIGEPQRARNHSTFLKSMMVKYAHFDDSTLNLATQYVLYKFVHTDLSFSQARKIAREIELINIDDYTNRVRLYMRPAYEVADIPFDEEHIDEHLKKYLDPISSYIPEHAFTGQTLQDAQEKIVNTIDENITELSFVEWAYENYLWLQIEDEIKREQAHFDITNAYAESQEIDDAKLDIWYEYVIEKEDLDKEEWAQKGREQIEVIMKKEVE